MNKRESYINFLKEKVVIAPDSGLDIEIPLIKFKDGTALKPHQRDAINWAIKGGRRALFESFGLGKTIQQLLICWTILEIYDDGRALIVAPLGVRQEFKKDAANKLGIDIHYVRSAEDVALTPEGSICITNYERVRDGNIDPRSFVVTSLDELGKLPATFETLKIPARGEWVWSDVNRMITLNTKQTQKRLQNHICPLQFDIVDRVIERYSNPGELVLDPFGVISTVAYRAVKLGRKGYVIELNPEYYRDGLNYLRAIESNVTSPTLFTVDDIAV